MKPTTAPVQHDPTRRLLEEGVRSYLRATNALTVFEQEVQKACRQVLEKRLDEYSAALGVDQPFRANEIRDAIYNGKGEWLSLGVEIVRKNIPPAVRYWAVFCMLYWEDKEPGCYCYVGEWFNPRSIVEEAGQRLRKLDSDVKVVGNDVGLYDELKIGDAGSIVERLDTLLGSSSTVNPTFRPLHRVFLQENACLVSVRKNIVPRLASRYRLWPLLCRRVAL